MNHSILFCVLFAIISSITVIKAQNVSQACLDAFEDIIHQNYTNYEEMIFASGTDIQDLGKYDMCQDLENAHYCILEYQLPEVSNFFFLKTGLCVPSVCSNSDLESATTEAFKFLGQNISYTSYCASKSLKKMDYAAIIVTTFLSLLAFLVLLGSITECIVNHQKRELKSKRMRYEALGDEPNGSGELNGGKSGSLRSINSDPPPKMTLLTRILLCWGAQNNLHKLTQPTSVPKFNAINGLRCMSMFWVILAHTAYWAEFTVGYQNPLHVQNHDAKTFWGQFILSGTYSVDPFFYMTGFLVCYLSIQELKKKGKISLLMYYLHRYIRLTPAYLVAMLVLWKLLPYLGGASPFWHLTYDYVSRTNCDKYWWTNLLYINNFYPDNYDSICMGWSWYMSNDFQMYILAPIFFLTFRRSRRLGVILVDLAMIACLAVRAGVIWGYQFSPYVEDPKFLQYETLVYSRFYTRAAPFLWGILFGFILHWSEEWSEQYRQTTGEHRKLFGWKTVWAWFVVVGVLLAVPVFVPLDLYRKEGGWSRLENTLYLTFGRFLFGAGIAIMMHICYIGQGSIVNKFLSLGVWSPIGRLTYCAYLYHPILMSIKYYSDSQFFDYNVGNVAIHFLGFTAAAFMVSFVSFMILERPLMNLEKIFIRH